MASSSRHLQRLDLQVQWNDRDRLDEVIDKETKLLVDMSVLMASSWESVVLHRSRPAVDYFFSSKQICDFPSLLRHNHMMSACLRKKYTQDACRHTGK